MLNYTRQRDPLVLSAKRIEGRSVAYRASIRRPKPAYSALAACLSAVLAFLAVPCRAHGRGELGHHWEMPEYRAAMQTQIWIMIATALAVLVSLWLAKTIRARRMRG